MLIKLLTMGQNITTANLFSIPSHMQESVVVENVLRLPVQGSEPTRYVSYT